MNEARPIPVDYQAYINSNAWKTKRYAYGITFGWKCQRCGIPHPQDRNLLHLHHKTYARLGHERIEDVELICVDCHSKEHFAKRLARTGLKIAQ